MDFDLIELWIRVAMAGQTCPFPPQAVVKGESSHSATAGSRCGGQTGHNSISPFGSENAAPKGSISQRQVAVPEGLAASNQRFVCRARPAGDRHGRRRSRPRTEDDHGPAGPTVAPDVQRHMC